MCSMTITNRARERLKRLKQQVGKTESEKAAKEQELRKRATVFTISNICKHFKRLILPSNFFYSFCNVIGKIPQNKNLLS